MPEPVETSFNAVAEWVESGAPDDPHRICVFWRGKQDHLKLASGDEVHLLTHFAQLHHPALAGLAPITGACTVKVIISPREPTEEETVFITAQGSLIHKVSADKPDAYTRKAHRPWWKFWR